MSDARSLSLTHSVTEYLGVVVLRVPKMEILSEFFFTLYGIE